MAVAASVGTALQALFNGGNSAFVSDRTSIFHEPVRSIAAMAVLTVACVASAL